MFETVLKFIWRAIPKPIRFFIYKLFEKSHKKCHSIFDFLIDHLYGVETANLTRYSKCELDATVLQNNDPYDNIPGAYFSLLQIVRRFSPNQADVVYDLGCGLGRALFVFARKDVKKIVGIEFNDAVFRNLKQNVARYNGPSNIISLLNSDVLRVDLDEATIIYMFNPFGRETMDAVTSVITESLYRRPRKLKIIYWHPLHLDVLQKIPEFKIERQFISNKKTVVFANIDAAK